MPLDLIRSLPAGEKLKNTRQRQEIVTAFMASSGHQNLREILGRVQRADPRIGFTTVYRTLKLLTRLGLAVERRFGDGETRYEPVSRGSHHDHLICLGCGKIIEFEDHALEDLQTLIARRHRFKIHHHRLELYGCCSDCGEKSRDGAGKRAP
jgi:Fur family transcriptional regulator, ferric uptake regulator